MKKIIIVPNPLKDIGFDSTTRLCKAILQVFNGVICLPAHIKEEWDSPVDCVVFESGKKLYNGCDLIIVLGGDGTIIRAALDALEFGATPPIIGFNHGKVGYLAEGDFDDIGQLICTPFNVQSRSLLEVRNICANRDVIPFENACHYALNDVVLSREGSTNLVEFLVSCDGITLGKYRADGLIVATPTGSTAYSLSAGGPIVDPTLDGIIITPICPHTLSARPIVLSQSRSIEIENTGDKPLFINVDGRIVPGDFGQIALGERVSIIRSEKYVNFVSLKKGGFFERLKAKLL